MTQPMRESDEIRHIPIERIEILNPRERNQKVFREIVASIQALGLKKPITVTRRGEGAAERFVLVCGQGRVEAFKALGQSTIPALVVDASWSAPLEVIHPQWGKIARGGSNGTQASQA
jgi:ParB family chromosome partitioning protein